jgi:hypothetical protein
MFEEWVQIEPRLKAMNVDELCADFEKIKEEYLRTGRTLFGNFLDMI